MRRDLFAQEPSFAALIHLSGKKRDLSNKNLNLRPGNQAPTSKQSGQSPGNLKKMRQNFPGIRFIHVIQHICNRL